MRFYNRIGYHDYEGVADDLDERGRLTRDLGSYNALILRNHGLHLWTDGRARLLSDEKLGKVLPIAIGCDG